MLFFMNKIKLSKPLPWILTGLLRFKKKKRKKSFLLWGLGEVIHLCEYQICKNNNFILPFITIPFSTSMGKPSHCAYHISNSNWAYSKRCHLGARIVRTVLHKKNPISTILRRMSCTKFTHLTWKWNHTCQFHTDIKSDGGLRAWPTFHIWDDLHSIFGM